MAEIAYNKQTTSKGELLVVWETFTENDTCETFVLDQAVTEISFHIKGTFGGATISVTGSNDAGAAGPTLQQLGNTAAEATAEALFSVLERPLEITPTAASGTSQDVDIYMLVRK